MMAEAIARPRKYSDNSNGFLSYPHMVQLQLSSTPPPLHDTDLVLIAASRFSDIAFVRADLHLHIYHYS